MLFEYVTRNLLNMAGMLRLTAKNQYSCFFLNLIFPKYSWESSILHGSKGYNTTILQKTDIHCISIMKL